MCPEITKEQRINGPGHFHDTGIEKDQSKGGFR